MARQSNEKLGSFLIFGRDAFSFCMRKRYKTSFSRVIFYSSKLSPILHPPTSRNVGAQEGHHLLKRLAFDLLSKRWFLTCPERVDWHVKLLSRTLT